MSAKRRLRPSAVGPFLGVRFRPDDLLNGPGVIFSKIVRLARRAASPLDSAPKCSANVLMPIESLSEAHAAGWRVHARCLGGVVDNTRSKAKCRYQAELSLETLVWTRGQNMPLAGLRERMMCPRCGNRRVNLIFDPPSPVAARALAL